MLHAYEYDNVENFYTNSRAALHYDMLQVVCLVRGEVFVRVRYAEERRLIGYRICKCVVSNGMARAKHLLS